eukprot:COSAG01_NODE_6018_length_3899_cov_14.690263_2_plen_137_part_00
MVRSTLPDGTCGGDMISVTASPYHHGDDHSDPTPRAISGLLTSNVFGGCRGPQCHEFYPPGTATRQNLTLHFSVDGETWRPLLQIFAGNATYSSMADLGNGLVGVLYDQGTHTKVVYAVVSLGDDILGVTGDRNIV